MKKLNVYFDIDGVLLGTKSPKKDIIKLLRYCLHKYPNSTYWLTTHCKSGENKTDFALKFLKMENNKLQYLKSKL